MGMVCHPMNRISPFAFVGEIELDVLDLSVGHSRLADIP